MNWKGFLKPSAFKILGTLILYFPVKILLGLLSTRVPSIIPILGSSIFIIWSILALILPYLFASILERFLLKRYTLAKNKFLKPTHAKVLITGIIFVLTIFIGGFVAEANSVILNFLEYLISPHYLLYSFISHGRDFVSITDIIFSLFAFILGFVYWYFLSCFIVWIYDKIREKPLPNRF